MRGWQSLYPLFNRNFILGLDVRPLESIHYCTRSKSRASHLSRKVNREALSDEGGLGTKVKIESQTKGISCEIGREDREKNIDVSLFAILTAQKTGSAFVSNVHPCVPKKLVCRKNWCAEKNVRYFDLKHLKICAHLNISYHIL